MPVSGLYGHGKGSYGQVRAAYGLRACPYFARTDWPRTDCRVPTQYGHGTGVSACPFPVSSSSSKIMKGVKGSNSYYHEVTLNILSSACIFHTQLPNCFWIWRTHRTFALRTQFWVSFVSSKGRSKEAVGNSWDILYAILCGHTYHQHHPNIVIRSE